MKTWHWLGYLGLIPFVACLWLTAFPLENFPVNPQQGFLFYSATILSFISGTLWQKDKTIHYANQKSPNQALEALEEHHWPWSSKQIISNIFCLLAFVCLFNLAFSGICTLPRQ